LLLLLLVLTSLLRRRHSYHTHVHLRDPSPFRDGPPPNTTLLHATNSTLSRVALRYSNSVGIKVGEHSSSVERCGPHVAISPAKLRSSDSNSVGI